MKNKESKAPTNTSRMDQESRLGMLASVLFMGPTAAIEGQERAGQGELVDSDTLPVEMRGDEQYGGVKKILQDSGVVFLGPVQDDPLFQYVKLPLGWTKKPTEHSMHTDLLDDKGRRRAGIFYKAAFYDRRADLRLCCRFTVRVDYERRDRDGMTVARVLDQDKVLFETDPIPKDGRPDYEVTSEADKAAWGWLKEAYPNHADPSAYWELP